MLRPCHLVLVFAALLGGCRSDDAAMRVGLTDAAQAAPARSDDLALRKKTFSDRVLTAIALERVTGRKPDPRRLLEPR